MGVNPGVGRYFKNVHLIAQVEVHIFKFSSRLMRGTIPLTLPTPPFECCIVTGKYKTIGKKGNEQEVHFFFIEKKDKKRGWSKKFWLLVKGGRKFSSMCQSQTFLTLTQKSFRAIKRGVIKI